MTWLRVFMAVLLACYVVVPHWLGTAGAVVVLTAVLLARTPWSYGLLALGAVPLGVVTWWSAITPLLAVVTVAVGVALVRGTREPVAPA
jgi:hypothetical protein